MSSMYFIASSLWEWSPLRRTARRQKDTFASFELQEVSKAGLQLVDALSAESAPDEAVEVGEHLLGNRLEGATPSGQEDQRGATILGIGAPLYESVTLQPAHHLRHRLLAQVCPLRELAHSQTIVFEEGQQGRPVRRADVSVAGRGEALTEELVPPLHRLGEQEAKVVPAYAGRRIGRLRHANVRRMLSNSRRSASYCDVKSSSGMWGGWNIVNVYALRPRGSSTTRVGKSASASSVGPAYMSMTPVRGSASMSKKNSPSPFTTFALPPSYFSSRANSVAHFGRFSISDRYENTRCLGASRTAVTVRLSIRTPPM